MTIGERISHWFDGGVCQRRRSEHSDSIGSHITSLNKQQLDILLSEWGIARQDLADWEEGSPDREKKKAIERILQSSADFSILIDLDETLANVRPAYVCIYLLIMHLLEPFVQDVDELFYEYLEKGRGSYFFRDILGIEPEEFDQLHHVLLQSLVVNRNLQQLPDYEHQAMMTFMEHNVAEVAGVLTTRPATVTAMQASREVLQDLFEHISEINNFPIIAREENRFTMFETNKYKIETLAQIAKETGKALILIDDNDSMRGMVEEYNRWKTADMPPIILIIYKNAEYTDKDWSENTRLGVYASEWQTMEETLVRVRSEWNL